jgi:hypothetical protein
MLVRATAAIQPRMKIEWMPWVKFFVEDAETQIAARDHEVRIEKEGRKAAKAERLREQEAAFVRGDIGVEDLEVDSGGSDAMMEEGVFSRAGSDEMAVEDMSLASGGDRGKEKASGKAVAIVGGPRVPLHLPEGAVQVRLPRLFIYLFSWGTSLYIRDRSNRAANGARVRSRTLSSVSAPRTICRGNAPSVHTIVRCARWSKGKSPRLLRKGRARNGRRSRRPLLLRVRSRRRYRFRRRHPREES